MESLEKLFIQDNQTYVTDYRGMQIKTIPVGSPRIINTDSINIVNYIEKLAQNITPKINAYVMGERANISDTVLISIQFYQIFE